MEEKKRNWKSKIFLVIQVIALFYFEVIYTDGLEDMYDFHLFAGIIMIIVAIVDLFLAVSKTDKTSSTLTVLYILFSLLLIGLCIYHMYTSFSMEESSETEDNYYGTEQYYKDEYEYYRDKDNYNRDFGDKYGYRY